MEKVLEMLVGPNWVPSAEIVLRWILSASIFSLMLLYIYKKYESKFTIAFLFLVSGMDYTRIDAKYLDMNPNFVPLSFLCSTIGFILILMGGAILFAQKDDGGDDEGDENPEVGPGPKNKKVVDDFLRSCQNKFLAGLRK